MSDKQGISKIQDSTVLQAGGNLIINAGLSASEVKAIVKEVVASELAAYSRNAEQKAEERLQRFSNDFVEQLLKRFFGKLERFNEPAVQMAVHDATLSYVKSGSDIDEKVLIDLLIERVSVEEHTTLQRLIDQAIKVVPILSPACLDLLSLVVFRSISYTGTRKEMLKWIESMGDIIQRASQISNLDIAFLSQVDCVTSIPGALLSKEWCDVFLERYDLIFRHPVPREVSLSFLEKYSIHCENGELIIDSALLKENSVLLASLSAFLIHLDGTVSFDLTDSKTLFNCLHIVGSDNMKHDAELLIQSSRRFQQKEVRQFFVDIDPNWDNAINLLDREPLRSIKVLPVGFYIGTRQLSMLSGRDVPFDVFYQ